VIPMTKLPGVPDKDDVKPGMASWEGNGPKGKYCESCVHRGYYFDTDYHSGCFMFFRQSGVHGPRIKLHYKACKHYAEKT